MVLSIYEDEPVFFAIFFTLGAFFVVGTILITFILILQHWIHYNKPFHQKYIVRIIMIAPIYACNSFLSLYFKRQYWSVFFDVFRDVYESYVLYCFFKLLICFLGGEEALKELLSKKEPQPLTWPLGYVWSFKPSKSFYRLSLTLVLQYTILKPVGAIVAAILFYNSKYIDGDFSPNQGYLYITIVNNISVLIALYFLVMFYEVFKLELTPHQPVLKFLVIKSVIFFLFWQTVIIYILIWFDALPKSEVYSSEMIGYFISDFLVCIEMFLTSIAMGFAFSYYDYVIDGGYSDEKLVDGDDTGGAYNGRNRNGKILKSFKNMKYNFKRYKRNIGDGLSDIHNQKDIILDTIKVVKISSNDSNNSNNNIDIGNINNNINNSIINNNNVNNNNNDEEYFNFVDLNSSEKDRQKKFSKYFKIQPDQQQTSFIHFDENNNNNITNNQFENVDINSSNSRRNDNNNGGDDGVILFTI